MIVMVAFDIRRATVASYLVYVRAMRAMMLLLLRMVMMLVDIRIVPLVAVHQATVDCMRRVDIVGYRRLAWRK